MPIPRRRIVPRAFAARLLLSRLAPLSFELLLHSVSPFAVLTQDYLTALFSNLFLDLRVFSVPLCCDSEKNIVVEPWMR